MDLELFKVVQTIIKEYSRQPAKNLIDHYLRIKILVKLSHSHVELLMQHLKVTNAEQVVFCNKNKQTRGKQFVLVCFDHPLKLPLAKQLIKTCDSCLIVQEDGQINNILQKNCEIKNKSVKGILFRTAIPQFQQLSEHLEAYFSVCELFMGHLHLVVSCFQDNITSDILQELQHGFTQDEFSDFREGGYFRMLEERASKITLEELSESCRIQKDFWGEMLVFDGGQDALIVWLTQNKLPLLNKVPNFALNKKQSKKMQTFLETHYGLKIFKKKEQLKQKLQNLQATVIIFNVKEMNESIQYELKELFARQSSIFFSRTDMEKDAFNLSENISYCERICEILNIDVVPVLQRLMKN